MVRERGINKTMSDNVKDTLVSDAYSSLLSIAPAKGVLRVTLNRREKRNALDASGHNELARAWRDCSKPTVSTIHGSVVGAGLVAALLADISVASQAASLLDDPSNQARQ
jgi:enoyl-CoA hydratase